MAALKLMYDSVDPFAIPADAAIVAGYGDGLYQWSAAGWARFANAIALTIVVSEFDSGDILDVETGNATPDGAARWILRYSRPVFTVPTVYCNRSTEPDVRSACAGLDYDLWIATLDGATAPLSESRVGAVQYLGEPASGGHYDVSICTDWWPRIPTGPGRGGGPPGRQTAMVSGGGDADVAIAPRMDGAGVNVDVIRVTPEGHVEWQGNTPYWVLGFWTRIYTAGADGPAAVIASAAWVSPDVLLASIVCQDGQNRQNALTISGGWRFGAWEQNNAPFRVIGAPTRPS